jgi:hypothetical protein
MSRFFEVLRSGSRTSTPESGGDSTAQVEDALSGLITQVTNEIGWLTKENQMARSDLAGRMGVSPGRLSQVLSGGENLTLGTLATLATALGAHFELELRPGPPADAHELPVNYDEA